MIKAKFICPKCNKTEVIKFNIGEAPQAPKCSECSIEMIREYKKIDLGDIVSDDMLHLGQKMLYS